MKILNLYAGIGGNRKLWTPKGNEHEITAVEINPEIAKIYQDFFPNDKVIVGDAHQYLLEHFKEFDFIWSSPPCQTHSRFNFLVGYKGKNRKLKYPDMSIYQEIILLQNFTKGKWVVENVKGYYNPLINYQEIHRHYFWANFLIPKERFKMEKIRNDIGNARLQDKLKNRNVCLNNINVSGMDKRQIVNNMVNPELGAYILNCAFKEIQLSLTVNNKEDAEPNNFIKF